MNPVPFQMSLMKVTYLVPKMDDSLHIFLVLSGEVEILSNGQEYCLGIDDMLVVNPLQAYQIKSDHKNLCLHLEVYQTQIAQFFKDGWLPHFKCSTYPVEQTSTEKFTTLRIALVRLMTIYFRQNGKSGVEIYQYLFTFLNHLVKDFKEESQLATPLNIETTDSQLHAIFQKIQKDYDKAISLKELAEESGLSYYHLSRLFKKQVGVTFTDYLNQIRLIHATEELLQTNHSIVMVALNNGFSSSKNFYQCFKKSYGRTPTVYRKEQVQLIKQEVKVQRQTVYEKLTGDVALQELAKYLVEKEIEDENAAIDEQLELSLPKAIQPIYQAGKKIVKIGLALEGLASGVQKELTILQKELKFDLVLFEGFCEETNFENNVHFISEYILNNQWFDFLVSIQLKPMIQLTLPEALDKKQAVQQWCDKQLKMMRHFLNRYGLEELNQWFIQWQPTNENKALNNWGYRYYYQKLKRMIPACQIGIMSIHSLANHDYQNYQAFIKEQQKYRCLPDFISFHADPYTANPVKTEEVVHFKKYQQDILQRVKSVVSNSNEASDWHPALFLIDWNTLVGEGNTFSGTFFRSALILESIVELTEEVAGIGFWLNIKVKERRTHKREDSSLSVFLYEQLRRPLFFSLRFLNQLKGELIAHDKGYILTRYKGQYQLLLYNSSYLNPLYSIDSFQVQGQTKKLTVHLKNLPAGDYLIRQHILDKDHGGIYNDWIRVGGQVEIDLELQSYLEHKISPKFELSKETIGEAGYLLEATLTLNACQLYIFQPIH